MRAFSRAETDRWTRRASSANDNELVGDCFGHYIVLQQLAHGAHRAFDGEREVVLRRLHRDDDWQLITAFVDECRLVAQLAHENVARQYAHGKLAGTYFAASELVRGPTLREVLVQCRTAAGAAPIRVTIALLIQLCDALAYLHARPQVVASLAPHNLAIDGRLVLLDPGVARSPLHPIGRTPSTPRADLFAAGALAHELLVNKPLFANARDVRTRPIAPPSRHNREVGLDLDDIVMTALQRDPSRRWQNAAAMRRALRALPHADRDEVSTWLAWAFARAPRRDTLWVSQMLAAIR